MEEKEKKVSMSQLTDFDKALQTILDENIGNGYDIQSLEGNTKSQLDIVNEELLRFYEKHSGLDFEEELKKELKEKIGIEFELHTEEEREAQIRDLSEEALAGEKIDEITKKQVTNEVKEQKENISVSDFKQELRKQAYLAVYAKYTRDVLAYKKQQLNKEAITVSLKGGIEAVMAERYLNNFEQSYRNYAKEQHLETKDLEENEEVKKTKSQFNEEIRKMDVHNDREIAKNVRRIEELNDIRNTIAKQMSEADTSSHDFKEEMDALQVRYMQVTLELNALKPSMEEYLKQEQVGGEIEGFARDNIHSEHNNKVVAGDFKNSKQDTIMEDKNVETLNEIASENEMVISQTVSAEIAQIKQLMKHPEENEVAITELLESIEMKLGIHNTAYEQVKEDSPALSNEQLKEDQEKGKLTISDGGILGDCKNGVEDPNTATTKTQRREELENRLGNAEKGLTDLENRCGVQNIESPVKQRLPNH